ncbi:hypothetical protein K439DRAFT_1613025 [Ramaria rubella]|nr:hypothetical protein K439DRAFT_1613025 [Ramaria rubella]
MPIDPIRLLWLRSTKPSPSSSATDIPIDPSLLDATSSTTSNLSSTVLNSSVGSAQPAISSDILSPVTSNITNVLKPTSTTVTKAHSPKGGKTKPKRKVCEEFSMNDLDQLLRVVIEVDPYMAPHKQVGERWREVTKCVQAAGYCLGHDHDTLKNKVAVLLAWVEGGKPQQGCYPLGCEVEEDEVVVVSLSGKLDSVAGKKLLAKETKEANKVEKADANECDKIAGENMHVAMMHGMQKGPEKIANPSSITRSSSKRPSGAPSTFLSLDSSGDVSDKENDSDFSRDQKCAHVNTPVTRQESRNDLSIIVGYLAEQKVIQAEGVIEQCRANDINEHTSVALIDILRAAFTQAPQA